MKGNEGNLSLEDHLKIAALGQHSIRFLVDIGTGSSGIVEMERGTLRHVEIGALRGVEALRVLMSEPSISVIMEALHDGSSGGELDLTLARALDELAAHKDGEGSVCEGFPGGFSRMEDDHSSNGLTFERAFAEGVEASLRHEHHAALAAFERALAIRPDDPRALHNVQRLREIVARGKMGGQTSS